MMFNLAHDIDSLTNFKRQSAEYLDRLKESGEPVVLTVNGKANVVIQDAAAYQKLVEAAAKAERGETVAVTSPRCSTKAILRACLFSAIQIA